uniref:RNase adapter protein RapZ n=1 Tax=Candidatus Aschnera chinzeii TaxID=1485666 RepID=A0AAT9G593_9ENTR|nr:MAG: RNase adapter RapZ [Candidatus Aschnera chinzeii]
MILIIVSGRSGSGKSIALKTLEDIGFYCVDNMPINLLPKLANTLTKQQISAAISIDVRNIPNNTFILKNILNHLSNFFTYKLLFLDANRNTLIRRYSDTRRLHPLYNKHLILENAIDKENKLLQPIRSRADLIIDTSDMSVHELSETLKIHLLGNNKNLKIIFESFGFKYGIPINADYVFDVRFLPNPYWDPNLRTMTGLDKPVSYFLTQHIEVHNFIHHTCKYLTLWLPMLESNNRSYLTIAIGCTGGKHRSVYITEKLTNYFRTKGKNVFSRHLTLKKK